MPSAADTIFSLLLAGFRCASVSAQEVPLDAGAVRVAVLAETNACRASKNNPQNLPPRAGVCHGMPWEAAVEPLDC
jgi:hypothetical protein